MKLRQRIRGNPPRRHWYVEVSVRRADGRRVSKERKSPINTKRDAEVFGRELERELARDRKAMPTVADFSKDFMDWSRARNEASTIAAKEISLRRHIIPALGKLRLDEVTPMEVERMVGSLLREKKARKTVNNTLTVLRKMLNLACDDFGILERAPKIRPTKVSKAMPIFLDADEARRFLAAAPAGTRRLLLFTGLWTGMRSGELLALRWEDIDFTRSLVVVKRSRWRNIEKAPKSGKARAVPLPSALLEELKAHRHLRGPYVFCQDNGQPLTPSMVKDWAPDACRKAGLAKRATLHKLRHSYATRLMAAGNADRLVQELLGHSSDAMTRIYQHVTQDHLRAAVDRLAAAEAPAVVEAPKAEEAT